ncbi:hypothetical protein JXA32_14340 [Candidatus Sumerlaeota bacterium]|nr:hypothetical protein [Candidatus Sumerlaeota bacterium]
MTNNQKKNSFNRDRFSLGQKSILCLPEKQKRRQCGAPRHNHFTSEQLTPLFSMLLQQSKLYPQNPIVKPARRKKHGFAPI